MVIGVCTSIDKCDVIIKNNGIADVNVTGLVCMGDKLTTSDIPGKARAIRYDKLDETQFNIRSIGKVIGVYDTYDKVKVMLDIE